MLSNYFKVAVRNLRKNSFHTTLIVVSLVLAITCSLLSFLYVYNEFTYEKQFPNADRIFRVSCRTNLRGDITQWAPAPAPLGPALQQTFPEVTSYTRVMIPFLSGSLSSAVTYQDKTVRIENVFRADSTFFDLFPYDFLYGSPLSLRLPDHVVISEDLSEKIFGLIDPTGKVIVLDNLDLTVGAVVKRSDTRTHMNFSLLISWNTFDWKDEWLEADAYTYVLFSEGYDSDAFNVKLDEFVKDNLADVAAQIDASVELFIQPIKDIHLHSNLHAEFSKNGNLLYVYVFLFTAIFILLIAAINYINIAIAGSLTRAKEVGVRKSMGANRAGIRNQFLAESLLVTVVAFVIGVVMMIICLPGFERLMNVTIDVSLFKEPAFFLTFLFLIAFVSILSGAYPALYVASFDPTDILKNSQTLKTSSLNLRKGLTTVQFTISIILVIVTLIIADQLSFIEGRPLGFEKEDIVVISVPSSLAKKVPVFKQQLELQTHVRRVALCSYWPGIPNKDEHALTINGQDQIKTLQKLSFDENYIALMKLRIVAGRNFNPDGTGDYDNAFLVNETAVKEFGWVDPIGQEMEAINDGKKGEVIGVINDANLFSLHQKIEPVIIQLTSKTMDNDELIYVKLDHDQIKEGAEGIKKVYEATFHENSFEYGFLDDLYGRLYSNDRNLLQSLIIGCVVMVLISCMGLIALSAVMATKRKKEIGIRKVLGASANELVIVQMRELAALVIIANVIAIPGAYYFSFRWLDQFSYKTAITMMAFVIGSGMSVVVVCLSVGFYVLKTARLNPVDVLRGE
ncbi:ABC transporter permease [soil metagenome]